MLRQHLANNDWAYDESRACWFKYLDARSFATIELRGGIYFYEQMYDNDVITTVTSFDESGIVKYLQSVDKEVSC